MWKYLLAVNIILFCNSQVFASDLIHSSNYANHTNPDEMDRIGPVFKNSSGISSAISYSPQYGGQKDRYNENQFKGDPEVLISTALHPSRTLLSNSLIQTGTTIQQLDSFIKNLTYDPKYKLASESRSTSQVISENMGNCFEVARLAQQILSKAGYETKMINIKVGSMTGWHSICIFKELDGTWSLFQAGGRNFMGYTKGNASNIQQLLNNSFVNVMDYQII